MKAKKIKDKKVPIKKKSTTGQDRGPSVDTLVMAGLVNDPRALADLDYGGGAVKAYMADADIEEEDEEPADSLQFKHSDSEPDSSVVADYQAAKEQAAQAEEEDGHKQRELKNLKKQILMVERKQGVLKGYTEVLIGEKPSAETDEQQN